jgi:hypothetical protein
MSPYAVATAVAEQMPDKKWAHLWIKPSKDDALIDDFMLVPPFTSAGWVCVGKVEGKPKYDTRDIVILTFHIKWVMQMYQSMAATPIG